MRVWSDHEFYCERAFSIAREHSRRHAHLNRRREARLWGGYTWILEEVPSAQDPTGRWIWRLKDKWMKGVQPVVMKVGIKDLDWPHAVGLAHVPASEPCA